MSPGIERINYGLVAQLGERRNGIAEVVGSIPIESTILFWCFILTSRFPDLPSRAFLLG